MIVRVQKHTDRYTVIDNTGLNDPRLSWKARGLLAHLLTKPDNWEVSVAALMNAGPDGRESVQKGLQELRTHGYANLIPVMNEGVLAGKKWIIYERPLSIPDNQPVTPDLQRARQTGFPSVGKADCRESRLSGNQQQASTDAETSTVFGVNTNAAVRAKRKKSDVELLEQKSPPSSGAPPRISFEEAGWVSKGKAAFRAELLTRGDFGQTDLDYYFDRCVKWSGGASKGKSSDWVQTACNFIQDDIKRGKTVTLQPITNQSPINGTPNTLTDTIREKSLALTKRYLAGIGQH